MPRTAPVPNIPAIPGMNPGVFVMGGGGGGGGGSGKGGRGSGDGQGANGHSGGDGAEGGGHGAGACGQGGTASGCPNHHAGSDNGQISRGDPVDVVTGRVFTEPVLDLDLPGPFPLRVERTYSSRGIDRDMGLGPGWSWTLAWQLHEGRRGVRVLSHDGLAYNFGSVDDGTATLGERGWLLHREGWLTRVVNGRGQEHRLVRDARGLVIEEVTFDGRRLRYGYDKMARCVSVINGLGERTEYTRDAMGRIIGIVYADGAEVSLIRNAFGDVIEASNDAGCFIFERNAVGWITSEVQVVDGDSVRVDRQYRLTGEIERRRTSLGHEAEWRGDADHATVELVLDGAREATSQYDAMGRESARELGGGAEIRREFDGAGRLKKHGVFVRGAATPTPGQPDWVGIEDAGAVYASVFGYTPSGLLAEERSSHAPARAFGYDSCSRLTELLEAGRMVESASYDDNGNAFRQSLALDHEYSDGDRLERVGATNYRWDDDGRLIEKRERRGGKTLVTHYHWSAAGTLSAVLLPDGRVVSFAYDPFARRVHKQVARREGGRLRIASTTRYVWDGKALVHEIRRNYGDAGEPRTEVRTYVFEQGRTVPVAHRDSSDGTWWHYLTDDSGAVEALVDGRGRLGCRLSRTFWGHVLAAQPSATSTPLRYRGQWADEETGLSYNRHRYFDPQVGRYISADPIGIAGGLNVFTYAGNCPTSAVDVEGLMFSVIKDGNGNVVARGHNLAEGGGVAQGSEHAAVPGRSSCAETTALTNLANGIGPGTTSADIARLFNEKGYTIETYEGNERDYDRGVRIPANPCSGCAAMFNDMGIEPGQVQGHAPRRKNRLRPWDGHSTYEPTSKNQMRDARRRGRRGR
ncbi:MAG TPA: RHS repeat-associated core domain-containing protein [Polyangiaceae bacterium]|nr:RHS repeat-associated core domain-containing protein [Polyangiaceae bacterium]